MTNKIRVLSFSFISILYIFLFYKQLLGINVFLFEFTCMLFALKFNRLKIKSLLPKIIITGTLVSSIMIIIYGSTIAKTVNVISFILLIGVIISPSYKLISSYMLETTLGITKFFSLIFKKINKRNRLFKKLKIILIPFIIIQVFTLIYYTSNDYFADTIDSVFNKFSDLINFVFNFYGLYITTLGIIIGFLIIYAKQHVALIKFETKQSEELKRIRENNTKLFKPNSLKSEYKSGIYLFASLNLLLLFFNYTDVVTVWFYRWNGEFLKDFVHHGTYQLIFSLILSIVITLYYFRKNLNFYPKNKLLKTLAYAWIIQNIILLISLIIRTNIYVHHFALAYKRIGLYAFLIFVIILLITIYIKINKKKSYYYLIRVNSISFYVILTALACFNWDTIIAKYNIKVSAEAYSESHFLFNTLSDKTLPYTILSEKEYKKIYEHQNSIYKQLMPFCKSWDKYKQNIIKRRLNFISEYKRRNLLEWNYSDWYSYQLLN